MLAPPIASVCAFDADKSPAIVAFNGGWVTLLFAFAFVRFLVYRKRCLWAESVELVPIELREGAGVVGGRVETEDGGPAIRIEIDQAGAEWKHKNSWSHVWRETARRVHVRPFHLRLDDNRLVRVVPDEKVKLIDEIETGHVKGAERQRVAEVSAGERIWVRGNLRHEAQSGKVTVYCGAEDPFVISGTAFEPLDISSGKLTTRYAHWRKFYRVSAIVLGVLVALTHTVVFGPYYAQCMLGRVENATITGTHTYTGGSKNKITRHYVVLAKLADGKAVSDEVHFAVYEAARREKIKNLPFRVVPLLRFIHSIGVDAVVSFAAVAIVVMGAFIATVTFFVMRSAGVPWYERRRLMESQSGRLAQYAQGKQGPSRPLR